MKQAKIFTKIYKNNYTFELVNYLSTTTYFSLIKEQKELGYKQLIINSEIMIKIIVAAAKQKNIVLKEIVLQDSVDLDFKEEIREKVEKSYNNPNILIDLIESLAWASEEGSIDIEKISFAFKINENFKLITIICNGILSGSDIDIFFNKYILPILREYFSNANP